ncbi:DUF2971 domain-containing protein [Aeromonas hydrophila]|uniref:DUF2971 domain-containing protein n=1 Tax=Aeromonas hydrophila TaxID=644 RepID=UPI000F544A49|nr:DUF2971 domain-containing protein [Aeromonas hydrophila]RQM69742.1 DUF2971 domain-containing protein [Aeromonas hydrophila]
MIDEDKQTDFLYKYMPFREDRLNPITDGRFYYSCPLDFNDPFDCKPRLKLAKNYKESHVYSKARREIGGTPREWFAKSHLIKKAIEENIDNGFFYETLKEIGVLSLSRRSKSMLMWSHYADQYKGLVVELHRHKDLTEFDVENPLWNLVCFDVEYSSKRPINHIGNHDADLKMLVSTKNIDWEYESESRAISTKLGPGLHAYNRKELLSSVIAGSHMSTENLENLKRVVLNASNEIGREIKLKQIQLSKINYELEVVDINI